MGLFDWFGKKEEKNKKELIEKVYEEYISKDEKIIIISMNSGNFHDIADLIAEKNKKGYELIKISRNYDYYLGFLIFKKVIGGMRE